MLEGLSILLAEDDRFNRLLLSRMLRAQGAGRGWPQRMGRSGAVSFRPGPDGSAYAGIEWPGRLQKIWQLSSAAAHPPIPLLTADVVTQENELLQPLSRQGVLYQPIDEVLLVRQILA